MHVGVSEKITKDMLSAYPNPFSQQLMLNNQGSSAVQVSLLNSLGQVLEVKGCPAGTQGVLNTEALKPGAYILQIKGEGISETKKLLKQ